MRYTPQGAIELIEVDVPDPGPNEVQIEGAACGICAWDIATCKLGEQMVFPAVPGHEAVGYVRRVGAGVTGFAVGDRVAGGGFATLFNRAAAKTYKLPPSDLADQYWLVEPVSCVVTGLDTARLRAGDRVAVIGCGFMGLMLLQLLARSACAEVIALDVNPARLALAREFGIRETYALAASDDGSLARELKAREIDVTFDTSGAQAGLDLASRITRKGGQINLFGWIKGTTATFDPSVWHLEGFTVVNSSPSARLRDPWPPAIQLLAQGHVDLLPLVTHTANLSAYPALMRQVLAGDPTYIKGVVRLR